MTFFAANKINSDEEAIAAELRRARAQKNIKLEQAAADLKIKTDYLEALEAGDFHKLPAGVYAKNFLKEYAEYLGLNGRELAAAIGGVKNGAESHPADAHFNRRVIRNKTWEISLFLKIAGIGLLVLFCFLYLGYYLHGVISPPALHIIAPAENLATNSNFIAITGRAEPEATVMINGESVIIDSAGAFTKEVGLKNGLNIITITARKKYGRETVIQRQILVQE